MTSRKAAKASIEKLQMLRGATRDFVDMKGGDALAISAFLQVHHSSELVVKAGERDLARTGLSVARYAILRALSNREPMPLSWIASKSFSRRSNITAMIDRLERDGLVERVPDPQDRRIMRVGLTEAGVEKVAETRGPHRRFITQLMAPLSDDELVSLIGLLDKLSAPLEPDDIDAADAKG